LKINELFRFSALPEIKDTDVPEYPQKWSVVDPSSKIGIEVEVENVRHIPDIPWYLWNITEDGSLRNYGREFISLPIKAKYAESALRWLFDNLPEERVFSRRTSVHIHLNARNFTLEQLKLFLFVYLVFEGTLFSFVGQKRDKNIHCVPLLGSSLLPLRIDGELLKSNINLRWMKYCALNIAPIIEPDNRKGTIEFRHMHGTDDIDKLMVWINIILSLKMYVYKTSPENIISNILMLNTNSQYRNFAEEVFGEYVKYFFTDMDYQEAINSMEEGVTRVKLLIGSGRFIDELITVPKETRWMVTDDLMDSLVDTTNSQLLFANQASPSVVHQNSTSSLQQLNEFLLGASWTSATIPPAESVPQVTSNTTTF